ncbi:acyltransferase [Agarivorans sp. QJM3NY_25]|uniref:acyltransferase n=1 Tax=Agarivorans sp. QJM3NY_25 TaxID=3421430 RepID=UPI003D7ED287
MISYLKQWILCLNRERHRIIDYLYLRCHGVETSYGYCRLVGFPVISRVKGSAIIIEDNVTVVSKTKGNIAGVNNRSIIATIAHGATITLKNGSGISGAKMVSAISIELGKHSGLGVNSVVYDTDFHPICGNARRRQKSIQDAKSKKVLIGDDVLIGANSIILKGTVISNNVVVGAGSVAAGQTLVPNSVYAGNPCIKVKDI